MRRTAFIFAWLLGVWQASGATHNIGFEAAEGYVFEAKPPAPWLCKGGNNTTSDSVRVTNTLVRSGSQSLSISPVFYDYAVYPVIVPSGASASFSVWIRTGAHITNYESLGYVGVLELDEVSEYWSRKVYVDFENYLGLNGEGGVSQFNLACNAPVNNRIGDFSPLTWYRVDCSITSSNIQFVVTIDTGTVTNTIPRYDHYRIQEIQLGGAGWSVSYFDDFTYTSPDVPATLTVVSSHGSPVPSVGAHSYFAGNVLTCQVAAVTQGLTNYAATSWTLSGATTSTGSGNPAIFMLPGDATFTWSFRTNYWLESAVLGSGSVSAATGFYAKDSTQELSATPQPGWLFMGWQGDASGSTSTTVTLNVPKSVTAIFSDDADNDGLTNTQEASLGTDPRSSDTDNDKFDDGFEFAQGLSPTNDNSAIVSYIANRGDAFRLYPSNSVLDVAIGQALFQKTGGNATLSLQLQQSADLTTWTHAGDTMRWTIPLDSTKQFYRVRATK